MQHALATSASTLVMYVNPTLVERAGGSMEDFPDTFDGVIELAGRIDALGDTIDGIWVDRHDWRFQSLLGSYGGRPMTEDESDIAFDDAAGIAAATLYRRFVEEGGMERYIDDQARQAFPAGTIGIMLESSSLLTRFEEAAGDAFEVTVKPLPVAADDPSQVYFPTGGSAIVMLTEDPDKQQAAWEYIRFVTGPEGARIVVENYRLRPDQRHRAGGRGLSRRVLRGEPERLRGPPAGRPPCRAGGYSFSGGPRASRVTDLIAAALVEIAEGADPEQRNHRPRRYAARRVGE